MSASGSSFENYGMLVPFLISYFVMIVARYTLPDPYSGFVAIFGIFIMFGGMVLVSFRETLAVAKFSHLSAWIRPAWKNMHFFYSHTESKKISDGRYLTELRLGFLFNHPEYGKIDKIFVYHNLAWKLRIKLRQGFAWRNGFVVEHSNTDHVVMYEHSKPLTDHGIFYPAYDLIEAGSDYPYMAKVVRESLVESPDMAIQVKNEARKI